MSAAPSACLSRDAGDAVRKRFGARFRKRRDEREHRAGKVGQWRVIAPQLGTARHLPVHVLVRVALRSDELR